jgi:formate dehydrogenase major subunit
MTVRTQTAKLQALRKGVMELYISDHPLDCLTCAANGDCELQDMAGVVGLREVRYGMAGANHFRRAAWGSSPRTNPTPTSLTTRPSASSATAACAPARKCRAASR